MAVQELWQFLIEIFQVR